MSYKKKKMKNSRFGKLKYKLGLVKAVLLKFAKRVVAKVGERRNRVFNMTKAIEVFKRYDRLQNSPDISLLKKIIASELEEEGLLRLCVFVCPKFNPEALVSEEPEEYMPVEAGPDLFEPRIQKILSLRKDLMKAGLPTEINLIIGDNDAEEYVLPFCRLLFIYPKSWSSRLYKKRQQEYCASFRKRCQNIFGESRCVVWSLSEMGVSQDDKEPSISDEAMKKEINFFKWLFSFYGPYKAQLGKFSDEDLTKMARMKYKLYGAQGRFLEMLGGILLQTEGPGVWYERTQMLRCTGSSAIPAIYPWIRKDEKYK
jgi:hypothetical protein